MVEITICDKAKRRVLGSSLFLRILYIIAKRV